MTAWGIIYGWMKTAHINGVQELAEISGIPYGTLLKRKQVPQEFRARELRAIRQATGMSTDDYYHMAEAAGEGR